MFLCDFAQNECSTKLTAVIIARVFGIQDVHVSKIQPEAQKKPKPPRRPLTLSPEQEDARVAFIESGYENGKFTSHIDVLHFIESDRYGFGVILELISYLESVDSIVRSGIDHSFRVNDRKDM
jgi:hypothetical protein